MADKIILRQKVLPSGIKVIVSKDTNNIVTVKYYNKDGKLHNINDKPAIVSSDGTRMWYHNGEKHRDGDKPAVIYGNGDKLFYKNNKLHRDNDKPAIIYYDGVCYWFKEGKEYFPEKAAVFLNKKEKAKAAKSIIKGNLNDSIYFSIIMAINSKRKGKRGELEIAKLFQKRFGLEFARVPDSGSIATIHNLHENANKILAGDIITPDNFKFIIEVKSRKEFNLWEVIGSSKQPEWSQWWQQAREEAQRANREPMVVVKYNNRKIIAFIDKKFNSILKENDIRFIDYEDFSVVLLNNLFKLDDNFFIN